MHERRARYRRGLFAEWVALLWLLAKGYWPLSWRYKTPVGEIDLVVKRGARLVFVEVKGRPSHRAAAEAVHGKNQARVIRAAQYYLQAHPSLAGLEVRFDVCLIAWYKPPHHLINAFQ